MTRTHVVFSRGIGTRLARVGAVTTLAIALGGSFAPPANAYTRPGNTEMISWSSDGFSLDDVSQLRDMTPDGRFVVFSSRASNVLAGRTLPKVSKVFLRDRVTGALEWISHGLADPNNDVRGASISDDGRFVAFASLASNVVEGDTNGVSDVFIKDRSSGVVRVVSRAPDGSPANGTSAWPSVSGDGRFVAYCSDATNLVAGDNNASSDAFVTSISTGQTERVSLSNTGAQANKGSCGQTAYSGPDISTDGRIVAFDSDASNLVVDDLNDTVDVFVRDRSTNTTEIVSVGPQRKPGNGESYYPSISADGRYVGFVSWASDLVAGDSPGGVRDIDYYLHDRATQITERISVSSPGVEASEEPPQPPPFVVNYWGSPVLNQPPAITPDGRFVAFLSWSSRLTPGDINNGPDAFVRDRWAHTTERVSLAIDEASARFTDQTLPVAISADGRVVAFTSSDPHLVPGDANSSTADVFIRDRGPGAGIGDIRLNTMPERLRFAGWARIPAARLSEAADAPTDGDERARPFGSEIVRASVIQRPEEEDLLLSLDLSTLPSVGAGINARSSRSVRGASLGSGATTPLVYGFDLVVDAARYQVRGTVGGGTVEASTQPAFQIYRCTASCVELARLPGGIGVEGSDVKVSVPIETIEAYPGTRLTGLRAFTGLGEARLGSLQMTDEVILADATVPTGSIRLGVAPASSSESSVAYKTESGLIDGEWVEILDISGLQPAKYRAWVKTCFNSTCWSANKLFEVN